MADDQGEYDFDLELYCIVCDRQIDPRSASLPTDSNRSSGPPTAPSPSPRLATSVNTSPAPPNPTPSSSRSTHPPPSAAVAPKLKRTGSGHSTTSNGTGNKSHGTGGGAGGLKRNKSLGKVHHAAGGVHRRNHSHANLHGLAPMTNGGGGKKVTVTAVGPAAEREKEKEKGKEKERESAKEQANSRQIDVASTLYCSEECKRIDEARNQLTLAHLGSSNSPSPAPFPLSSPSSTDDFDQDGPYASMVRRRSSGVSSSGSTSYAFSSQGERGLSPIMSAAPTSNPAPYLDSSGFPFPSVSSSSSTFARHSPQSLIASHPSNSSLNSLPSQQSYQGPAPLLNFSSRRQSRGAHSSGAYSYRPSLMERVHSTDSTDSGVSETRNARSLTIGGGSLSAGLFNRVKSMDGLVAMGRSDSETSDREGRQAQSHRPPSALSSLRSMTPILNGPPSVSSNRSRPPLASSRYSEPASSSVPAINDRPSAPRIASDSIASSDSRSRSRSRKSPHPSLPPSRARSRPPPTTSPLIAGSDPPEPVVGSLPTTRSRGLSFGSPTSTTTFLRPVPVAPSESLLANRRTSSSASLALLGSSLSRSHDHRAGPLANWASLKRTDSTAGLSGLNAVGEISAPSASSPPPSSSSTASTFIPAPSTYQQRHHAPPSRHHERPRRPSSSHSHPHSSPSSTSSFGPSQSSVRTSSSRRSTAASSDHWQGVASTSLGSNAGKTSSSGMHRTRSGSSSRPDRPSTGLNSTGSTGGGGGNSNRINKGGLTMTPSHTNLTNIAPPSPTPRPHSSLAPAIPTTTATANLGAAAPTNGIGGGGNASRTWSWTNLHVPTYQALDVSEYRARKERTEKGSKGNDTTGEQLEGAAMEGIQTQKKERKRLFYFSDNGE
ncbi:hypothetical protein JCM5350_006840 [Sporobolomyces pararoseus]